MNYFALNDAELNGDPEVWITDSSAYIPLSLSGDVNKARFVQGTAQAVELGGKVAYINTHSELEEHCKPATQLSGAVQSWLHSLGALKRDSYSSTGQANFRLSASGEIRKGGKIKLEGKTVFVAMYSRGELGGIRYRYLSGEAAISLLSSWSPNGDPDQPDYFIPAQDERVLYANRDNRTLIVPREVVV